MKVRTIEIFKKIKRQMISNAGAGKAWMERLVVLKPLYKTNNGRHVDDAFPSVTSRTDNRMMKQDMRLQSNEEICGMLPPFGMTLFSDILF